MMKGVWKKLLKNEEQFETLLVEQERINDIILARLLSLNQFIL